MCVSAIQRSSYGPLHSRLKQEDAVIRAPILYWHAECLRLLAAPALSSNVSACLSGVAVPKEHDAKPLFSFVVLRFLMDVEPSLKLVPVCFV